jgi:hypothetical protein
MRDVALYFRKKTGIPKLTDSGLADVICGEGLTVRSFPYVNPRNADLIYRLLFI